MNDKITAHILLLEKERDEIMYKINTCNILSDDIIIHYGKELEAITLKIGVLFILKYNQ